MDMNVGYRIYPDFQRPDPALVELFRGIPSSNIGDNTNRLNCMYQGIRPFNRLPLLGVAFTVKAPMGDNLIIHRAMDLAKPGDVIVVDGQGALDRSLAGEIMITYAAGRGVAGFIFDGAIRDVDGIRDASIPVYAKGVTPQGPYKHGPGEINVPICCGGQVVFPGDILVGDEDGVVVVRPDYARALAQISRTKFDDETRKLAAMRAGDLGVDAHIAQYGRLLDATGAQVCG